MLLNTEQKDIFCRWLELQISTSKGIEEQLQKLNVPIAAVIKREQVQQAACRVVLNMIRSGEEMTL